MGSKPLKHVMNGCFFTTVLSASKYGHILKIKSLKINVEDGFITESDRLINALSPALCHPPD